MLVSRAKSFATILITLLVCLGLWFSWIKSSEQDTYRVRKSQAIQKLSELNLSLTDWFRTSGIYLKVAAETSLIQNYQVDPDATVTYLKLIGRKLSEITQLRILSTEGFEVIRIQRKSGKLTTINQRQLQDKSNRYYFVKSKTLLPNEIYISPIDLNEEFGKVEEPWTKTVRLSTPIYSQQDRLLGYLIFNFDIGKVLTKFENRTDPHVETELIDSNGFWVAGKDRNKLFGAQINPDQNLAKMQPGLWTKINERLNGSFLEDKTHYTSHSLGLATILDDQAFATQTDQTGPYILLASFQKPTFWTTINTISIALLVLLMFFGALMSYLLHWAIRNRLQEQMAKRKIERQYLAQDRMASLGRLVAGVSHELKQPLGNVYSANSVTRDLIKDLRDIAISSEQDQQSLEHLQQALSSSTKIIENNIQRARSLLDNFQQTANHQSNIKRQKFNLGQSLKNITSSFGPILDRENIDLIQDYSGNLTMDSYPAAISQAVINLIENARKHAFAEGQSGRILIKANPDPEKPLSHIQLKIKDDGMGIPTEKQSMVFEPFFTTQVIGRNSGLGLSIVQNMVNNILEGTIELKSEPGRGTTFQITLPRYVEKTNA
ncbi:sensor histidine kinase [Sneathiella limimaris]|uniref:sensor histidine kinase n=1 Tax=Sneathiella limimaris TaxID=1964213 RepID=UPI00146DB9CC|nr:HAMP domain-containing sensor histidine kinase [Sneathiella limimaris]